MEFIEQVCSWDLIETCNLDAVEPLAYSIATLVVTGHKRRIDELLRQQISSCRELPRYRRRYNLGSGFRLSEVGVHNRRGDVDVLDGFDANEL